MPFIARRGATSCKFVDLISTNVLHSLLIFLILITRPRQQVKNMKVGAAIQVKSQRNSKATETVLFIVACVFFNAIFIYAIIGGF